MMGGVTFSFSHSMSLKNSTRVSFSSEDMISISVPVKEPFSLMIRRTLRTTCDTRPKFTLVLEFAVGTKYVSCVFSL
jgi:hypothetical protein